MAKINFYYGAMGSGKTIEVIQTAYKYNSKGMKAVVCKPGMDTKGGNKIVSRIGMERELDFVIGKDQSFLEFLDKFIDATCLIIDEAQFLTEKQVLELVVISKEVDVPIICYGLKTDFKGNYFEGSSALIRYADYTQESKSICSCGHTARFNARKIDGEYVYDGEQIVIGADESYEALCEKCYLEKVLIPNNSFIKETNDKVKQFTKKFN